MSPRFVLSSLAAEDLDGILAYVLEHSGPARARHVADRFEEAFLKLAEQPGLGHTRADLTAELVRFWPVWSYLVVYKPGSKPLEVARVLHGARDLRVLLADE